MSQNRIEMNNLLDLYGELLTTKQQNITDSYYREDLSISEIAENEGISRAAVHDALKHAEQDLLHYEEVLHLLFRQKERETIYQHLLKNHPEDRDMIADIQKLQEIEGGYYE